MNNFYKGCIVGLVAAVILLSGGSVAYCDNGDLKTFRGTVQEIDWAGSLLTVSGMDEMTFYVPPGTRIIWGTETVGLSDLEQEDPVVIKYYENPNGAPRASSIMLDRIYSEF